MNDTERDCCERCKYAQPLRDELAAEREKGRALAEAARILADQFWGIVCSNDVFSHMTGDTDEINEALAAYDEHGETE